MDKILIISKIKTYYSQCNTIESCVVLKTWSVKFRSWISKEQEEAQSSPERWNCNRYRLSWDILYEDFLRLWLHIKFITKFTSSKRKLLIKKWALQSSHVYQHSMQDSFIYNNFNSITISKSRLPACAVNTFQELKTKPLWWIY